MFAQSLYTSMASKKLFETIKPGTVFEKFPVCIGTGVVLGCTDKRYKRAANGSSVIVILILGLFVCAGPDSFDDRSKYGLLWESILPNASELTQNILQKEATHSLLEMFVHSKPSSTPDAYTWAPVIMPSFILWVRTPGSY